MKSPLQTASQQQLPPKPDLSQVDPLVVENTRFSSGRNRTHRYTLFRYWGDPQNYCAFIGMNPSGADEVAVDRTVNRCIEFSKRWGFGAIYMLNNFALRTTNPAGLFESSDPIGPENDYWIGKIIQQAPRVVVAWGKHGGAMGRGAQVEKLLLDNCSPDRVLCFDRNKDGSPKHPLYQPGNKSLTPYFSE